MHFPPNQAPLVGVIMGSTTDLRYVQPALDELYGLEIPYEAEVVSAHRTPDWLFEYASTAQARGLLALIAAAGGAAHLPGMVAAKTVLPVIGIPTPTTSLLGLDSLFSIVQMPKGTPVATMAIGEPGAANAAFHVARILGLTYPKIQERLKARKEKDGKEALAKAKDDPNFGVPTKHQKSKPSGEG